RRSGTPDAHPRRLPSSLPSEGYVLVSSSRSSGSGIILARPLPAPTSSGCDRVRPPLQLRGSEGFAPSSLTRRNALTREARVRSIGAAASWSRAAGTRLTEPVRHGDEHRASRERKRERIGSLVVGQVLHLPRDAD